MLLCCCLGKASSKHLPHNLSFDGKNRQVLTCPPCSILNVENQNRAQYIPILIVAPATTPTTTSSCLLLSMPVTLTVPHPIPYLIKHCRRPAPICELVGIFSSTITVRELNEHGTTTDLCHLPSVDYPVLSSQLAGSRVPIRGRRQWRGHRHI